MSGNRIGHPATSSLARMTRRSAVRQLSGGGLAAGALALAAAGTSAQSGTSSAFTEAAARRVVNAINQTLVNGDTSLLDTSFSPDYINHTPRRSLVSGQLFPPDLTGLKDTLLELRGIVPDAAIVIEAVIASGDEAAVRVTFRGTLDAAVIGQPEAGNMLLRVGGMAMARFIGGQVRESWDYDEAAELFARPAPTTPTPQPTPSAEPGELREVQDFQEVSLEGVGTLVVSYGDVESLRIDAEPKVLKRIETNVRNGRLLIRPERSFRTEEAITYYLTVKQLDAIELGGAGRLEAAEINAGHFQLSTSGTASATIASLTADSLEVNATGSGAISIAGTVDQQTVTLAGTTRYEAPDLASRIAVVSVNGTAQATIQVSERLDAEGGGAAKIAYIGDPEVTNRLSGVASVTQVG